MLIADAGGVVERLFVVLIPHPSALKNQGGC